MAKRITTFLLADDDRDFIYFVERVFADGPAHLRLKVVEDGIQMKDYLEGKGEYADRQRNPLPHVILMDLKMPHCNGFEFLQWRQAGSSAPFRYIPTIVMAGSVMPADVSRVYELGGNAYIVKPGTLTELKERISALGSYWGEHVETMPEIRGS